jgi:hypothetical protein
MRIKYTYDFPVILNKRPLLSECGGADKEHGEAIVFTMPNGTAPKAVHLRHETNGDHAYITPVKGMYKIDVCQSEGKVYYASIFVLDSWDEDDQGWHANYREVRTIDTTDTSDIFLRIATEYPLLKEGITAAVNKSLKRNCRESYYTKK